MLKKDVTWDVVVIGGGPSGMMAAGHAASRGHRVLLLEKNRTLGKKLLITGGGRCNLTNNTPNLREMLSKYKESDKFLYSAFSQFSVLETLEFFHDKGMQTKEEGEGRVFPLSNNAKSVLDVLIEYMKKTGVVIHTGATVAEVTFSKPLQQIVVTLSDKSFIHAKACVLATGGTSRPETGSSGEGFLWLTNLGHTVVKNSVALVPIALKDVWVKKLAGVTLKDVKLTTFLNGTKQKAYKGKLLFTHVGISGPMVLNMSKAVGELLYGQEGLEYEKVAKTPKTKQKKEVVITLDIFPALDNKALDDKIKVLLSEQSNKKIKNSLSSLIPPALVDPIFLLAHINGETLNHSVRKEDRKFLVSILKAVPLHVKGLLGQDKAVVSSGGVSLAEVNFKTMQSLVLPQLYLVGDILNIDRPSGGYSLQLCWTTGFVAGNSC